MVGFGRHCQISCRLLIPHQGGIRHIQLAMRSHVSNDLVQRAACAALANLALRYDDIRKQCVSDGVLKNVINAMTAHKVQPILILPILSKSVYEI